MSWLVAYAAVAASFYLASAADIHRGGGRRRRLPDDPLDRIVLHLVALLAALLWPAALPTLIRVVLRRLQAWWVPSRLRARALRLARLAG